MDGKGDFLAGVVIGVLVGVGVGFLVAPASGEETRQKIKEQAGDLAGHARERSAEFVQRARSSAEELAAKAREGAKDAIEKIRDRVASGGSVDEVIASVESELS